MRRGGSFIGKIAAFLFLAGLVSSLGSIATFIVMNVTVGQSADATLVHHQRIFAAAISRVLTIPGVCMLFVASILSAGFSGQRPSADIWSIGQLALSAGILANTMVFVRPLVAEVSKLAALGAAEGLLPANYSARKQREDRFGTANFLMIVAMMLIAAFRP